MDVHVSLIGRRDLAGEIYRQLRAAIVSGRLRPGDPLPPTRELARRLSVSRSTVTVAYDRLHGEGFVSSQVGAGTFVSPEAPVGSVAVRSTDGALRPVGHWERVRTPTAFAAAAEYDFRTGVPDASRFPLDTWRRLTGRALRPAEVGRAYYGDPAGHPPLREAIARHIGVSRGVQVTADQIIVTNGTQQALDIVAAVLAEPGADVAVEDPGYTPPHLLFRARGLRVTGVPVDDEGIVVDEIPDAARLVYVTPSHQYPVGTTMSLARRAALLQWADRHGGAIVEDDYDSEFRFAGRPVEPLQTLDRSGRVVYVGSFSKTMLPTLRLGFVAAPPSLVPALQAAKYLTDWHTSLPTQVALAWFLDEGHFARHLRRMRAVYRERHDRVVDAISRGFADDLRVEPSSCGLHVSATALALGPDDVGRVVRRAAVAGVAVQPLSMFRVGDGARAGVVVGYGAIEVDDIDEGLRRLRRAVREG